MNKKRRIFKKDEFIGLRVPTADRERFEKAARATRRSLSDFVWDAACQATDRLRKSDPNFNSDLQQASL